MTTKRYRVLDYFWHAAHGARLLRIPADWTYFQMGDRKRWEFTYRPLGENLVGWATDYEPGEYDVAILHIDQWSVDPRFSLRSLPYHLLNEAITDIPKIVIMHGLPEGTSNLRRLWQMIGNNYLVTNTEWSRGMMGLPADKSWAIVPGYDVEQWHQTSFERAEVLAVVAGSKTVRDHHGVHLITRLKRDGIPITWVGRDIAFGSFEEYRDYLAGASAFLNPCQWSQHPGARNEAMLSGLPIVSTFYTDDDLYVRHGEDGILENGYVEIRDALRLMLLPEMAVATVKMGHAARVHARELFDHRRYVQEWLAVFDYVTKKGVAK